MDLKLLISYNIKPNRETEYYRYVLGEFLPRLQNVGLLMVEGWHTAYGNYPLRMLVFKTQDDKDLRALLRQPEWVEGKETLLKLVQDYEEHLVPAGTNFQFFLPSGHSPK